MDECIKKWVIPNEIFQLNFCEKNSIIISRRVIHCVCFNSFFKTPFWLRVLYSFSLALLNLSLCLFLSIRYAFLSFSLSLSFFRDLTLKSRITKKTEGDFIVLVRNSNGTPTSAHSELAVK